MIREAVVTVGVVSAPIDSDIPPLLSVPLDDSDPLLSKSLPDTDITLILFRDTGVDVVWVTLFTGTIVDVMVEDRREFASLALVKALVAFDWSPTAF